MLAATIPAQIWIDRWGRRMPLIIGGVLMAACFIINGALYAAFGKKVDGGVQMESKAGQWVVVVLIFIFVANFSWSWAVVSSSCSPACAVESRPNIVARSARSTLWKSSQLDFEQRYLRSNCWPTGWSISQLHSWLLCSCVHHQVDHTSCLEGRLSLLQSSAIGYPRQKAEVLRSLRASLKRSLYGSG